MLELTDKLVPARPVVRGDYEDPDDARLRALLDVAWPLQALVRLFLRHLGEPWLNGKITGKGVRVSPEQLGDLYRLGERAAGLLGVAPPELFVTAGGDLEPTLLGVGARNTLGVSSALLEKLGPEELFFVLGREMGHIRSQHVVYLTLLRAVRDLLGSTLRRLAFPVLLLLHAWQRAATLSADRAGLVACQSRALACRTLVDLELGWPELRTRLDPERYVRAGLRDILEHPIKAAPELFEQKPYLPRRLASLYAFEASAAWSALFPTLRRGRDGAAG